MSIIIKGMNMPKNCGECRLYVDSIQTPDKKYDCNPFCFATGKNITFIGELEDFCPLVEIPTPHGRLIDGDELAKVLDARVSGKACLITMDAPTILETED